MFVHAVQFLVSLKPWEDLDQPVSFHSLMSLEPRGDGDSSMPFNSRMSAELWGMCVCQCLWILRGLGVVVGLGLVHAFQFSDEFGAVGDVVFVHALELWQDVCLSMPFNPRMSLELWGCVFVHAFQFSGEFGVWHAGCVFCRFAVCVSRSYDGLF